MKNARKKLRRKTNEKTIPFATITYVIYDQNLNSPITWALRILKENSDFDHFNYERGVVCMGHHPVITDCTQKGYTILGR